MPINKMKLGRKPYKVQRYVEGTYGENGLWVSGGKTTVTIRANIQGGLFWNGVRFDTAGDVRKQAISIRSDEALFMPDGDREADIIEYQGSLWEVRDVREYSNLRATRHWEAMATLLDGSVIVREGR